MRTAPDATVSAPVARVVRRALAAVAVATLACTLPARAAEKDDRSFARAADSLIQLFTGAPSSTTTPAPERTHTAPTLHHTAPHAATVSKAEQKPAPPSVSSAAVAAPVVRADSVVPAAAVHAVVVAHHEPAKHVAVADAKHAPGNAHGKKKSTQGEDWLKLSGPPAGDDAAGSAAH